MRKIFIADAHLKHPDDVNYRILMQFLSKLRGNTDTLFILGDLFEFWIGYRNMPFTQYKPVLEKLKELRESGTEIVYFEGNHDFHMGPYFENDLRAEIFPAPRTLSLNGKRLYLCHGDQIINKDFGYRILRFLLHNRFSKVIFPMIPYAVTSLVARHMSRHSQGNHHARNRKWDYTSILRKFASDRFASGCDVVITAHFHAPHLESTMVGSREKVLLALGDWKTQFSYGEWMCGTLAIKTFVP